MHRDWTVQMFVFQEPIGFLFILCELNTDLVIKQKHHYYLVWSRETWIYTHTAPFTWTQFAYLLNMNLLLDSCLKACSVNPKGLWSGEYSGIEWMRVGFFIFIFLFIFFLLMRMKPELKVRKTPAFPERH